MLVPKNLGAWPTPPTWPQVLTLVQCPCPWCYRPATARVGRLKGTSQPRAGFRSGKSRQDHGKAPARLWGNYSPEKPGEGADHVKITSRSHQDHRKITPRSPQDHHKARAFCLCNLYGFRKLRVSEHGPQWGVKVGSQATTVRG